MCKLIRFNGDTLVADIKQKYIANIVQQAKKCSNISRIVLFGSAIETRCTSESDIDVAIFGKKSQGEYLRSKEFKDFQRSIFSFENDFTQDYDILYFCENGKNDAKILNDINRGSEIFRRASV